MGAATFKARAEAIVNVVADKFDQKVRIVEAGPTAAWFDKEGVGLSKMHLKEITERMGDKCVKGVVYHEAGHALLSDLAVLDAFKGTGGGKVFTDKREKALVVGLLNPGEDIRVEERLSESYEGVSVELKRFMANTSEFILERLSKETLLSKIGKATIIQGRYPELAKPFMDAVDEKYHPIIKDYAERFKRMKSTEDVFMGSVNMAKALRDAYSEEDDPDEGPGPGEGDEEGIPIPGGGGGGGRKGKKKADGTDATDDFLEDMVGDGSTTTSMDGETKDTELTGEAKKSVLDRDEKELKDAYKAEERSAAEKFKEKLKEFGETDFPELPLEISRDVDLEGTYVVAPGATEIIRKAESGGSERYSRERTELRGHVKMVSRRLKDLFILQKKARFAGSYEEGTHIALSKAYKILHGDYRVFQRKIQESAKDTGIMLLCDLSGSMSGGKVEMLRQTITLMAEVLDQLKVPFEVLSFTSHGSAGSRYGEVKMIPGCEVRYDNLLHEVVKDFNESLTPQVKGRIGDMEASSENWDGEALVWAYNRLKKTPYQTKHLWVLSDGLPSGSGSQRGQAKFLKEVAHAIGKRVNLMGIGYCHTGVKRFYENYILVNEMGKLPEMLVTKVKELLVHKVVV